MIGAAYVMLVGTLALFLVMVGARIISPNDPKAAFMMSVALVIIVLLIIGRMFFKK